MSLNRVTMMGRITRDLELRHTTSGVPVTSFSIACEKDYKSASGEKEAEFYDIVCWRGTAEFAAKYFGKGKMVIVDGRLQTRDYTDKNGSKHKIVEIVADSLYFGESKTPSGSYGTMPASVEYEEIEEDEGEDLPF